MKKLSLIIATLLFVSNVFTQSTKIWLTISSERQVSVLQSKFNLDNVKKALPNSKTENLQKVYEIEIAEGYTSFIKYVNDNAALTNLEVIEEFTPLYEPDDYSVAFTQDYALNLINAKDAWNITKGSPLIKIGISDSNFDTLHEELAGTFSYISNDINGSNYNHGTAVAVTAAGNTNNGVGKSSIGNQCDLMLYGMNYNHILQASYAGARVINLSWASGCYYNSYYQSVINEVHNNGTVIIAAAGNGPTCGGAENYVYPASFEHVIAVSSIGPNDNHQRIQGNESSTHQHNDQVDLVAPGYDVPLTISNNTYTTGNGTSFAAPYVAGTVGLMLSVNPCLSPSEVEMILKTTAVSVDEQNPLYHGELGAGRLDAHAAVQMAEDLIPIDFDVIVNEASCTSGVPNVSVQLLDGDMNDYNLQWSDGSSDWTRNNLSPGNYNFTISSPTGCSINQELTFQPTGPYFDYPNSIFIENENFTLIDSNNDGVINVRGTMIIGNEIDYDIKGLDINFTDNSDLSDNYPNSGIVVKDGSKLSIDGANLNSVDECSNNWGGIELWSEPNNIAIVSIENTSIENAKVGVSNISKYAYNNELSQVGGQINMTNSTITSSKIGVNIIETFGPSNTQEISNNTFLNSANITSSIYINLNEANSVSIKNNTFSGSELVAKTSKETAIRALNSVINPLITKPSIENLSFNNTYNNLYIGVDLLNSTEEFIELKFYNELFNNVDKCLSINGLYIGEIVLSEFNITPGTEENASFGIKTLGENNLLISENIFYGSESVNNYGIISESNTTGEATIKLNTFDGNFMNGINFIGENSFNEVSCNNFNIIGQYDWFIDSNESGQLGSLNINEELNLNQFSDSNNVVVNLKNHNDSEVFNYTDAYQYTPYEVSENITVTDMQIEIELDQHCYSEINNSFSSEENLSTNEFEKDETTSLYPNPSNGVFKITSEDNSNINQVHIMTTEGKVIEIINWNEQQSIDLTSYSAGTYLVGLQLGSNVKIERVVIL